MNNKLADLNNHLFNSLERLMDEDLSDEEMQREIRRSEAVTKVAAAVIQNGELLLKTVSVLNEYGIETPKNSLQLLLDRQT